MDDSEEMRRVLTTSVLLVAALPVFAGEAVSSAFTLDLHYEPTGEIFPGEEGTEVWGLSSRWTAMTTAWAIDSNNDGIPDWWEQKFGFSIGGLPAIGDADGDGFSNLFEYNADMNPIVPDVLATMKSESVSYLLDTDGRAVSSGVFYDLNEVWGLSGLFSANTAGWAKDSDNDGIPDWWESLCGLNPNVADAHLDSDGDGRTNVEEYNAGTNPVVADDWNKSIAEQEKSFVCDTHVEYVGGNPSFGETFAVIKVSNGFVCDTGGLYYDWDGDGIPNWWEARYSRDGGKTGLVAAEDDDHDGMSNYAEFIAYTDPTNNTSRFVIGLAQIAVVPTKSISVKVNALNTRLLAAKSEATSNMAFALQWQSAKGRTYSVFSTDNLATGWRDEPDAEISGTGDVVEYIPSENGAAMFFKVKVRLSDDY